MESASRTHVKRSPLRKTSVTRGIPRAVPVCVGLSAVIAQIVLLRELMVVFCGNEMSLGLMLAIWLLWTAIGGSIVGRRRSHLPSPTMVAGLQIGAAVILPATIVAVRCCRAVFHASSGELLGPAAMLMTSVAALAGFCVLSGWLFPAATHLMADTLGISAAGASGHVYLLEAIGSGIGGLLASFVLLHHCDALQIAFIIGQADLICALFLLMDSGPRRNTIALATALACAAAVVWVAPVLDKASLRRLWPGYDVIASRNSIYGRLDVVESEGTRSIYENGAVAAHAEDPATAEEAVHFALLQHAAPRTLLLIGGGINGSVAHALQYATLDRIDYVELDPAIISLTSSYFAQQAAALESPRVRVHNLDARLFLKTSAAQYDVIIINLPEPQTAQVNRFYTREFFGEAAAKLNDGGVLSFQLRGAEDYISPELGEFLRCLYRTLRSIFPDVTAIPGNTIHFTAAKRKGTLTGGPGELMARLRERNIQASYVREYYLPFRMAPDRTRQLEDELMLQSDAPLNRDFAPVAYYFSVKLWSAQFGSWYREVFDRLARVRFRWPLSILAILVLAPAVGIRWFKRSRSRQLARAGFCVAGMGFTLMALEVLLLLGFQVIYGYVYHQLAIVIAAFMAGMALGSWLVLRSGPAIRLPVCYKALTALQAAAMIAPLFLYCCFLLMSTVTSRTGVFVISQLAFPALAAAFGALGGLQFQFATRVYFGALPTGSPALLYGIDLAGACIGAITVSAYLIPVFGVLNTGCFIAAINLGPLLTTVDFQPDGPALARQ